MAEEEHIARAREGKETWNSWAAENPGAEVDFSAAGHFTVLFAKQLLGKSFDADIDLLKIEVPSDATIDTVWALARLSRPRFYLPTAPKRNSWVEAGSTGYKRQPDLSVFEKDSDVHEVLVNRRVAVTPISLDMTSRVDFASLEKQMRNSS